MGMPRSALHPVEESYHGVIPDMFAEPLGKINLTVAIGHDNNNRKEDLTFEVVDFKSAYNYMVGQPFPIKFRVGYMENVVRNC
jgi:hypothetical protein